MKAKYIVPGIMFLLTSLIACEDFLTEDPKEMVSEKSLFEKEETIIQTLLSSYHSLHGIYGWRNFSKMYGITSDDVEFVHQSHPDRQEMNNYTFNPNSGPLIEPWMFSWESLSRANLVLDYIPDSATTLVSQPFIDRIKAEARFLRGWNYFNLVRTFKTVPLITVYRDLPRDPPRADEAELWKLIISDFQAGVESRSYNGNEISVLPGWKTIAADEKGRITRGAAKAALGWAYMTRASLEIASSTDMDSALFWFNEVINTEEYGLWEYYYDAFYPPNKNQLEDIFSFQQLASSSQFPSRQQRDHSPKICDIVGRENWGYGNFPVTEALYQAMEDGDERKERILRGDFYAMHHAGDTGYYGWVTDSSKMYTTDPHPRYPEVPLAYTQKWCDYTSTDDATSESNMNFQLIRYSNILLLHSEATNKLYGSTPDAYTGINMVRERSGLAPLSGLDQMELREAIRNERWIELHAEGVRWFDLMRWGIKKEKVEAAKPYVTVNMDLYEYFPIPQREVDANPNLNNPNW